MGSHGFFDRALSHRKDSPEGLTGKQMYFLRLDGEMHTYTYVKNMCWVKNKRVTCTDEVQATVSRCSLYSPENDFNQDILNTLPKETDKQVSPQS